MTTSLSGFIEFVRTDMGVTAAQVPDDSPSFTLAYGGAVEWVNPDIACVTPNLYTVAVYNLGASFLVNYGTESVFAEFRKEYGLNNFKAGVITGAGDISPQKTEGSTTVPVTFSGPAGFVIPQGFLVSDGTYTYQIADATVVLSSGVSSMVPMQTLELSRLTSPTDSAMDRLLTFPALPE